MSLPTITSFQPADHADPQGYRDGELAAITGLPTVRAQAITAMAADHDTAYADAYWHGYLAAKTLTTLDLHQALSADRAAYTGADRAAYTGAARDDLEPAR